MEYEQLLPILRQFDQAIESADRATFKRLVSQHRKILHEVRLFGQPLLNAVARKDDVELTAFLLDEGMEINPPEVKRGCPSALVAALHHDALGAAEFLLERGSDPNEDRTLISAINAKKYSLQFVKLLVEHGADIYRCFSFGPNATVNALSWAIGNGKHDIADYLRSKGAVMPDEQASSPSHLSLDEELVAYFKVHFGPVQPRALIEIVPVEPAIAIHVVPAASDRNYITLFTTGMSELPMTVPKGGDDRFRYAELFIQLPADWPLAKESLGDKKHGWPIHWLRTTAKYPHQNDTWLGGAVTILANDDPPKPIAPKTKFTSMLLLAERSFVSRDGRTIQLYRMTPLYTEERDLEIRKGIGALMQAFDKKNIPFVVDMNRPNVAASGSGKP